MNQNDELLHYGVKGQKWGIRRYQNPDGTLTSEGRKRAKQEYRADNKEAFRLGKAATNYGKAAVISTDRALKYAKKADEALQKDPNGLNASTLRKIARARDSKTAANMLITAYKITKEKAEKHCAELIDKYGKEAVSNIKYKELNFKNKDFNSALKEAAKNMGKDAPKIMNERTESLEDKVLRGAMAVYSLGLSEVARYKPETVIADTYYAMASQINKNGGNPELAVRFMLRMQENPDSPSFIPDEHVSGSNKHVH